MRRPRAYLILAFDGQNPNSRIKDMWQGRGATHPVVRLFEKGTFC